jgi:hypothetical protein
MRNGANPVPVHPTLEAIVETVADWVNRCRAALRSSGEFAACGPEEVKRIASDLGIGNRELHTLAARGPHSADLLQKMLPALGVDPEKLAKADPLIMHDLQRLCVVCNKKTRCQHELADGTAAADFRQFCPNAVTLDALIKANGE